MYRKIWLIYSVKSGLKNADSNKFTQNGSQIPGGKIDTETLIQKKPALYNKIIKFCLLLVSYWIHIPLSLSSQRFHPNELPD